MDTIIQFLTMVAVIIGAALVIHEVRATHDMTFVQLVHGTLSADDQDRQQTYKAGI